jgi:hypothetical protein
MIAPVLLGRPGQLVHACRLSFKGELRSRTYLLAGKGQPHRIHTKLIGQPHEQPFENHQMNRQNNSSVLHKMDEETNHMHAVKTHDMKFHI